MSRVRTDAVIVKPSNNVFTALTGAACVAVTVALVLVALQYQNLVADDPDAPRLFFGLFWPL